MIIVYEIQTEKKATAQNHLDNRSGADGSINDIFQHRPDVLILVLISFFA